MKQEEKLLDEIGPAVSLNKPRERFVDKEVGGKELRGAPASCTQGS